jgi:murein DD-endopeptidase MepM/ murein hydrolase activator NlpD
MTEPNDFTKAFVGLLTKSGSRLTVLKDKYGAKFRELAQVSLSKLALHRCLAEFSERIFTCKDNFLRRFSVRKDGFRSKLTSLNQKLNRYASQTKPYFNRYKKGLVAGATAVGLLVAFFIINYNPIYAVEVNGEIVGYVHNVEDLQESFDEVLQNYQEKLSQEVTPNQTIEFVQVKGQKVEVNEADEVMEALLGCVTFETPGHMLIVDGGAILGVSSLEEADGILQELKDQYEAKYAQRNSVISSIEFEQEVIIEEMDIPVHMFMEKDFAVAFLTSGGVSVETHQVVKGDSLWSISKEHSISLENLMEANPGLKGDTLSIGQELNMQLTNPYLNIISTERLTENVRIAFSEEVQQDSKMWTGQRRVAQRGQPGQKAVVYEVVRKNGVIIEKEFISESVIQKPVNQIIVRGTRRDSSSHIVGTGRFMWPVQGRITSPYGSRSGGFHTGVDIAAPRNTPIRAADDGTVTVALYSRSGYGNRVEVSHGNGYSTLYAHCNSLAVRQGETVKKGQIIAYVGSTGRSSGDHLHFEIRINGKHTNPMRYF